MSVELAIIVGSGMQVATITVDPSQVRGAGGALSPAIEMTFAGAVPARPDEAGIGIERVTLQLWLAGMKPPVPLGLPATRHWPGGGGFHSSARSTMPSHFQLRFPLTFEQVRLLEAEAARVAPNQLELEVRGDVAVGWLHVEGSQGDPRRAELPPGIQMLGLLSNLRPFWVAEIQSQRLWLTREQLAAKVLPGLGLDRVRLVAVRLPLGGGPLPQRIVGEYDAAVRDYDAGRYREAIEKCRDVRNTVEKALGAKDADGARVADQLGGRTSASQRMVAFIDDVWKGLAELTNEAHHPTERSAFTATGARACLLTTAVMVETVSELLSPAEL